MNCKELVYLLGDYIDGTMDDHLRQELSVHIELCEPCLNFLKTYDKTRILCREIRPEEIPEEVRSRLKAFVLLKAKEHHRDIEKYMERAAEERRQQVALVIRAYIENRLSPTLNVLFQAHRDRCERCGAFLRGINGGNMIQDVPPEIEEHIADFLEGLPPGENPVVG